jgi:prepilin-type N-terminal cleavage/methylation domain-containing protein
MTNNMDGFTLVELLIVIIVVGVLTAVAMPQYWKTVERSKANEAIQFFDMTRAAEDRYNSKYGGYCTIAAGCNGFDFPLPPTLHYFDTFALAGPAAAPGWSATLKRINAPAVYSNYVISVDVSLGGAPVLSCSQPSCMTDLLPVPLN